MIGLKINNYEILRLLGEGGMGAVYLAEHPFLGRKAAIKILKPECTSNSDYVQRFLNEARAANAIHHPNIIDIIDVGILPDGVPYMMMELLQGETLASRLRRMGRLGLAESLFVGNQIASALAAAHAAGIVHRDLKPDNIFVVPDPQNAATEHIKVLDFGIAKLRPDFAPSTPRTSAGALMGTPAYMSPEQCMGSTAEVDHHVDIYALGVILYELLCGRTPFEGQTFGEYLIQHVTIPPPPPQSLNPEIPDAIAAVILKALAKNAADRIQSMELFGELLSGRSRPATLIVPDEAVTAGEALGQKPQETVRFAQPTSPAARPRPRPANPRTPHPRQAPTPPRTTLSSSNGSLRVTYDEAHRGSRATKAAAIAAGSLVILGGVLVGVVRLLSHDTARDANHDQPAHGAAEPAPAFTPPPPRPEELVAPSAFAPPVPAAAEQPASQPSPVASDGGPRTKKAPSRHSPGKERPGVGTQPPAPSPARRQDDSPATVPESRHEPAPAPAAPATPTKIIKRDKF